MNENILFCFVCFFIENKYKFINIFLRKLKLFGKRNKKEKNKQ